MNIIEKMERFFNPETQMTAGQILAVASAISAAGPKANVLVFGLGNDSPLWHGMNDHGYTLFLEDNDRWLQRQKKAYPYLTIEKVSYEGRTDATSIPLAEEELETYPTQQCITCREWDVIIVDSPMGHKPDKYGRSLSIY